MPWSSFPCVQCVPWLTTEQIFYHGILGLHGKREQDVRGPHALVFISVCSVCSVVMFFSSVGARMSSLYARSFDNPLNDCFGIMAKVDEKAK